jgi:hypothetical protein
LWAVAIYDLHLTEEYFWSLTLRELNALLKRLQNRDWEYYRSAILCTLLINTLSKDRKFTPQDFLPGEKIKIKQSPEQMLSVIKIYQKYYELKNEKEICQK